MENTKLIMLEGLPGTGKSTNSYFLFTQLERNGNSVKWIHEVARPHPTLFFHEASLTYTEYDLFLRKYPESGQLLNRIALSRKNLVGIDLLEIEWNYLKIIGIDAFQELKEFDVWTFPIEKYQDTTLDKWAFSVEKVLSEKDVIYILDSSILQFQIFTFLLKNIEYDKLRWFVKNLVNIIKPLNPNLIYFYRENVEDSIHFLERIRGIKFMEYIWERDKAEPYYNAKPEDVEGYKLFLRDYSDIAYRLLNSIDCRKIAIEITKQDWTSYEQKMLTFVGIEHKPSINVFPPSGVYTNEQLNLKIEINGLIMKDPNGTNRNLIPKSDSEFYVECLPVIIRFNELGNLIISGEQICERWTTFGTQFIKTDTK